MVDVEKLLKEGNNVEIVPEGWSMYPFFVYGKTRVIVEPYTNQRLKRGMVVLYRREGSILVIHRIHHRTGDMLYLVGDNQTEVEGPLPITQVRGVMAGFYRKDVFVPAGSPGYAAAARVWLALRPVRPAISHLIHRLKPYHGE